ncbi:hypothetical protein B0T19DRAFT_482966 [Cercophora scortea]|uniref:Uncharacterized protein n=1 Tax=Cercophora scortea TaxID=314031 RepID=A0AAE0IX47_9PEZI|nr:hypothetical protein B0T19DRAFT_482966 [Cercophora scortea]
MSNPSFDISQWYNEQDLDYRTPELPDDSRSPKQNLVLAPGAFWDQTLKPKLLQLLAKKTPRNKCYEPDETNVVVSVTDRSQRDLTKRFDELDIEWDVVEDQLVAWSHLLREGKKLRIDISFIYKETTQQVAVRTQQTTRRGGEGNMLRTHGDVPPWIRELIYAKEHQDSEQNRDEIHIWNAPKLDIPRPIDEALYCYSWKNGYRDACKIAVEDGLDLERFYYAQDVEARSLAEKGVKRGVAVQFVSKVKAWLDEV